MHIPKTAHIAWNYKDVVNNTSPLIVNGLRKLIDLNPNWQVVINDDADIEQYLKQNLDHNDYVMIKDIHIVSKIDLWRLFKLYLEGGLYMDIDRLYNISLSEIITDNIRCVLPTYLDYDFSHDFMLSAPQNPIYAETINMILARRRQGHQNIYFLGPQTYMHAVTKTVLGEIVNTNPGIETFKQIRKVIEQIPFIKTYREEPPYNTVVYQDDGAIKDWPSPVKEFYDSYKVKHWTDRGQ